MWSILSELVVTNDTVVTLGKERDKWKTFIGAVAVHKAVCV